MAAKGRSAKPLYLGDFNFLGAGNSDHEGSVAFSDISFPSHVSDLESFHSDLDMSMNSRESLCADDVAVEPYEDGGSRKNSVGELPDLPEQASENVDVLLAALKAAAMQDSSSDRASIDSNKSGNSSNSNLDSLRFISKESFPESVLAEASHSWAKEASQSAEENSDEPRATVSSSEKCDVSVVKPSSESRMSEKFLAPSKTPDNGRTDYGADKSDRSPWSFSGDSLLFQTPRPAGDTSTWAKNGTSSKPSSETKTKPSSSSTPVETNQSLNKSKQWQSNEASITNDTFPTQQDRMSDMDFGKAAYNPFDGSYNGGLNVSLHNGISSKPSSETKTKPSSSSTPLEEDQSNKSKQRSNKASISNDTFPPQQDRMNEMDVSKAAYNPFDGSYNQSGFTDKKLENEKSLFGDGDGLFGNDFEGEFSFQSAGDAAKRLDEDEKVFEESHRFEKEDAMVDINGQSFSYYVLPGETRRSVSVVGINDPNDKGEVRISFGEFFAAKTEELGRLGDGNENRPRPQFNDTRNNKVSPAAMPPRPLYRPSSPEGSEKDTSYQPSFADLEKSQQQSNRNSQSQGKKPVAMATRSSPYGAEADEEEGKRAKEGKGEASRNDKKVGDKSKGNDTKSSKASSKSRQRPVQPKAGANANNGREDSRRNTGGLELNNSTLAALKFCNSSEGSKVSEMSSNELRSLSKTLAQANIDDAQEIYNVLVNFINNKGIAPKDVIENTQRLSEVFESPGARRGSGGQGDELQDGDAMTFYHSDTSCEVSPTDTKFRTMSSISSPPLDTSSPKSSGSSIGVQTDSHSIEQVSTLPTTLTMVASSGGEGMLVGTTLTGPVCTSSQAAGQYNGSSDQITRTHSKSAGFNSIPPKQYGSVSCQKTGTTPSGGFATSPIPCTQYVTIPSQTTPPGLPNTIPSTSVSRTLTPDPQNNPPRISPCRSYERTQSLTDVATSSVQTQQHIYGANSRPLGYSDPGILTPPATATYRPEVPRYAAKGYQTAQLAGIGEPSSMPRYPVEAIENAVDQQYYQITRTDQDHRIGRPGSGTSHSIATLSQAVTASCHVMPAQSHAVHLPGHPNTKGSHEFVGTHLAIAGPRHTIPVSNHAVPVSSYAQARPNYASSATNHAIPVQSHPNAGPNYEIPVPGYAFTRNDHAISDPKHAVAVSSYAAFKPIQTGLASDAIPPSRQDIPRTSGNILAQSCPAFSGPRLTSPETYPGFAFRTVQPGAASVPGKTRAVLSDHSAAYQDRHVVPSKFQEPKPMSAPHATQKVFNYHDAGPEEFQVVSDVYNQDGTQMRRPRVWAGPGQRQSMMESSLWYLDILSWAFSSLMLRSSEDGEVWNSRTERTSQIQMVIPPVLDFPGVLCVGTSAEADLSIYNPTSRWIRCSSEIVTCSVNGLKVDNQECPFSIRGKTMIGPKLTENIKVDFKCLSAGVYVAEMKVISTPVASVSGDIETSSAFVSLQGFAEEPKIEIIADELRTLDFGEIHHGCNSVKPLRIVNKGMTTVPLKMRICSNSSPGVFIFSKANSPEVIPELDLQNTTLKCLVPTTNDLGMKAEPLVIWIELAGKNHHCFEKSDEAQELSAGINIQLDTGTVAKILGNIQLSAVMGFTKIQIPKAFQMAMCLSSPVGKRVSREFPFTNAGSICANVELTIPKHLEVFSVTPDKFQVRPGMAVMVKVMFTPLVKDTCESVIQVLEPDNSKCYEVLLRGSAVEPQPEMDDGPPILSNKSWLCWTGVDLGNATHQRLFLLNDSADQSIHFQAMILGEHSDFEIQRMRSEFSKGGTSSEQMVLRPKERMPIYVLFAPSSFGVFKSALVLKPDRGPRFQIPLYAYGGKSCLSFLDLKKTSEGYDAQLGEVSLGRRNILKITVKNTGHRAAFVKAVCYADFQIRLHYHQTHLSIVPSEFVLPERSSKELVIVYQPLQHDAKACQQEMKRVATVVFYHGDEVLRQWYRRNTMKQQEFDGRRTSKNLKYDDIRFDKVFQNENCSAEDFDFPDFENYEQIFDSHISQTFLNLLGGSEKHVIQSGMGEESLVMATPRRRHIEPETETNVGVKNDADIRENLDKDESTAWSLIPEQLSLKVPVQGSSDSTKKVQLLNFSDRPLEFELIWPAHCIAVTPHTGTTAPNSQTTINISAWGSILKSGVDLPWSGTAYVKCDGIKKAIAIQIHNPLVSENSPAPSVIDKPLPIAKSSKDEPRLSQTYTAFVKPVKQTQLLKVTPTLIDFAEVEVNKASCSTVTIENISTSSIRWKISSFAPAYAKVSDTSSELLRATYPVFSFSTQSGFIRANQIIKIQVEFRARDAGDYCQIWDCQTNPESPLTSTKVKLELSGKAVVKETSSTLAEKDKENVDKKNVAMATARESLPELPSKETNEPQKGKGGVYFQSDNVEFPNTEVGQTSTVKIKICNKSSSEHQFRIITPSAPFYMKCTSLVTKPSHYLRIPVYFSPQEAGKHYEATVVFENIKSGESLAVKLRANSL